MQKVEELFWSVFSIPFVNAAVSQDGWDTTSMEETNLSGESVFDILVSFTSWSITLVGIVCVIVFIYGGFLYMTAQGENDKLQQAKKVIIYAVVGVVVAVLGLVIVQTVNSIFGGGGGGGKTV